MQSAAATWLDSRNGKHRRGYCCTNEPGWGWPLDETLKFVKPWVSFAGAVLIVMVLYWAQAVLVPFALAILLTFVLTPPVSWVERRVGRIPAVLVVATLVFTVLGAVGWGLSVQLNHLAEDLPTYRGNIREKIADIRGAGQGGTVEKLKDSLEDIKTDLGTAESARGSASVPVVVEPSQADPLGGLSWLGPIVGPLGTASAVVAMVIFMLLERRDMRDRLIGLIGHGKLATTTKAIDEAGTRVSRQLLMQSLVNLIYGAAVLIGLYVLHVPYPLVWAALGAGLRFIPYVGPVLGAGAPILISLAALDGWSGPLSVMGLFLVLELFTNLVLETALYAGAAGVSQVALLMSVAFWTWLWGPLGLLMATPLTVCLVVLGKHVPGLSFVGTLMADTPALTPEYGFYQRLLARDQSEAAELIDKHVRSAPASSVYDALMLPALNYAERDRLEQRLSPEEETSVVNITRELLADVADSVRRHTAAAEAADPAEPLPLGPRLPLVVIGYAVNGPADEAAVAMLAQLMEDLPVSIETVSAGMPTMAFVAMVREKQVSVVCLVDLPPSPSSKTRYLVKRLRAALPEVRIAVGRWATSTLADESTDALRDAGANHVATQLADTRGYLDSLLELPRVPAEPASSPEPGMPAA